MLKYTRICKHSLTCLSLLGGAIHAIVPLSPMKIDLAAHTRVAIKTFSTINVHICPSKKETKNRYNLSANKLRAMSHKRATLAPSTRSLQKRGKDPVKKCLNLPFLKGHTYTM